LRPTNSFGPNDIDNGSTSPPLHTDTTLQDQTLLTLKETQKWVIFPSLFQSSNSNYFNHLFAFFGQKSIIDFYRFVDVITSLFRTPVENIKPVECHQKGKKWNMRNIDQKNGLCKCISKSFL
jgi:hypothetical protein